MKRIVDRKYIKEDITKEWLDANRFRYSKMHSDTYSDAYTYRFPVYKYGIFTILECEIVIYLDNGEVRINVYDNNSSNKYAPFYYEEYGNYDKLLVIIHEKIEKMLNKFEIEEAKGEK